MTLKTKNIYFLQLSKIIAFTVMLSLFTLQTACSKTKALAAEVWRDRGEAYCTAEEYPTLHIPKGIAKDKTTDTYQIPSHMSSKTFSGH